MNTQDTTQTAPAQPENSANYSAKYLRGLPTIESGHFDNLKIQTATKRVWLSRCGIADGMLYDNQVTVEELSSGTWITVNRYQAL